MTLYGIAFEHRPGPPSATRQDPPYNPLTRVPTLVLDNGEVLIESHMILDYLDSLVSTDKSCFLQEPTRIRRVKVAALAIGLGDKIVSLFYEGRLHDKVLRPLGRPLPHADQTVLGVLEADRAPGSSAWWFGDDFGHADIAVGRDAALPRDAHPGLVSLAEFPKLEAHARGWRRCRSSRRFRRILLRRLDLSKDRPFAAKRRNSQVVLAA